MQNLQKDSSGVKIKLYLNLGKLPAGGFLSLLENTSLYAPSLHLFCKKISVTYSIACIGKSQYFFM